MDLGTSPSQSQALPRHSGPRPQSPKLALSLPKKRDNHPKPFIALLLAGWPAVCAPVCHCTSPRAEKNLRPEFLPLSLFPLHHQPEQPPSITTNPPSLGKVVVDNLFFLFDLVLQLSLVESLHSISASSSRPSRLFDCERASEHRSKAYPSDPHPPNGSHPVRPSRPESTRSGENGPALAFTSLLDSDPASATSQGHFSSTTLAQVGFDLDFNRSDSLRDWFTAAPFSS